MRAILDTQVFLWWNLNDARMSAVARAVVGDEGNELFLSVASAWEIAIKYGRGGLPLPEPPERYVTGRMALHSLEPLPVQLKHALRVAELPNLHKDPFDRLLIAQSQVEDLPILTADPHIARYDVKTIW